MSVVADRQFLARAQRHMQAGGRDGARDGFAAIGMPRHDHAQQRREDRRQRPVRLQQNSSSSPGWVDAATTIGRPRVTAISRSSLPESAGGAGTSSFRFPVVTTLRLPSAAKALRVDLRLREADVEPAKQRRDRAGDPAPARERTMRHPAVDQHHRQTPRRARQDQIGPQIGLDEQRETGPPMIEEARDIARRIVTARIDG